MSSSAPRPLIKLASRTLRRVREDEFCTNKTAPSVTASAATGAESGAKD
jgi:hypothetical protein